LGQGLGFAGGVSVDSNDPKNLVAWLAGHATTTAQFKPWRAKGDVTLRSDRIAVERLRTEIDGGVVEGSVSYAWPAGDRRVWTRAPRGRSRSRGVLGFEESAVGPRAGRPGVVALAIDIGRCKILGFDAHNVAARLARRRRPTAISGCPVGDGEHQFRRHRPDQRICDRQQHHGQSRARDLNGILALSGNSRRRWLAHTSARDPPEDATLQANVSMESGGDGGSQDRPHRQVGAIRINISARLYAGSARRSP
jgi:hypothetical protein